MRQILKRNNKGSLILIAQGANILSQFLFIFIISKMSGTESVGVFGIISAFVNPIQFFFLGDIGTILITKRSIRNTLGYFHFVFISSSMMIVLISAILFVVFIGGGDTFALVGFAIYKAIWNYREYSNSVFQRERMEHLMAKGIIVSSILALVLFALLYWLTQNLAITFTCVGLFLLAFVLIHDHHLLKKKGIAVAPIRFSRQMLFYFYNHGSKLGLNALINSALLNSPRYFIEYFLGDRYLLGVITLYTQAITAYGLFNQAIVKSTMGTLMNMFRKNKEKYREYLLKLMTFNIAISAILFIGILLFGKMLIGTIFGENYTKHIMLLYLLAGAKSIAFPIPIMKGILILFQRYNFIYVSNLAVAAIIVIIPIFFNIDITGFIGCFIAAEFLLVILYFHEVSKTKSFEGLRFNLKKMGSMLIK